VLGVENLFVILVRLLAVADDCALLVVGVVEADRLKSAASKVLHLEVHEVVLIDTRKLRLDPGDVDGDQSTFAIDVLRPDRHGVAHRAAGAALQPAIDRSTQLDLTC
jgi:hypothetical protein